MSTRTAFIFVLVASASGFSHAAIIGESISGVTASVSNGFTSGSHPQGSHFHSSNLPSLPAGNPPIILPGVAEVGGFFGDEEIRGVSEFNLNNSATSVTLRFDVLDTFAEGLSPEESGVDGLFGQGAYIGTVDVFAYDADLIEGLSDYQAPMLGDSPILSIEVASDLVIGGDTFEVDITEIHNNLVSNNSNLGIRLQMANPDADAGAITFNNFRLDLVQQSVPEPAAGVFGLLAVLVVLRRRQTAVSR